MSPIERIALPAWITGVWLVLLFPVTAPIVLAGMVLNWSAVRKGQRVDTLRHPLVLGAVGVCLAIVAMGGFFVSYRTEPLPDRAAATYAAVLALALQIGLAALAVARAPAPRRGIVGVMLVVLWVGIVATWLAVWAIEAGSSMGAL